MSNKPTHERSNTSGSGELPFCVRQFAMLTAQEYSCRPGGALADDGLKERSGT